MHQEKQRGYLFWLRTGSVSPDGTLQINRSATINENGGFQVYYWKPALSRRGGHPG